MTTSTVHPGQLMMVDIEGTQLDAETEAFLRAGQFGGVCLFRRNIVDEPQVQTLTTALRAVLGPLALIAIDQEGGAVARVPFLPQAPSAMALGALDDTDSAHRIGAAVGRGLAHLGFNWDFAPVVDVNNNPANPVIAERSFGADPARVTRLAGAWMRGATEAGVACCLKHFPGHGDTHADSHHALPVVRKRWAELQRVELEPFRQLASEADAFMTAHILYPEVDADWPATLSQRWLHDVLREDLGFGGLLITDALNMRAIRDQYGMAQAAVLALSGGADMVMVFGGRDQQQQALDALLAAQRDGELDIPRLQSAQERIHAVARRFPATAHPYPQEQRSADEALVHKAWRDAVRCLGKARPPAAGEALHFVTQANGGADAVSDAGVSAATLRAVFDAYPAATWELVDDLTCWKCDPCRAAGRRVVLLSNHRRRYKSPPQGAPDLHVLLWNPYQCLDFPMSPSVITWGHAEGALSALRAWLRGEFTAPELDPALLGLATLDEAGGVRQPV